MKDVMFTIRIAINDIKNFGTRSFKTFFFSCVVILPIYKGKVFPPTHKEQKKLEKW
ncbi:hypothetical protein CPX_001549 [Candidatus Phytoplasma pruni]|uniref:Uncharacterized protein n=1 Tax=Candidatus Phytoplasma pruni TaxID=479893 RepID=A0A0M1N020_9MOLU|nr:hypothetical protein CPX_001549 [Candidatus Phytoplasma pruni]